MRRFTGLGINGSDSGRPWRRALLVLATLAAIVLSFGTVASAAPVGLWSAASDMDTARAHFLAASLTDGKVLVSGGLSATFATSEAELYDPRAATWSPAGSMSSSHFTGAAVLLQSGKLLVAGGVDSVSDTATVELYDPRAGGWAPTGSMTMPRRWHTLTLLPDGRVLAVGGRTPGRTNLGISSAELYDPRSGNWTATGNMSTPRGNHTATLLQNGKVLVAGGVADYSSGTVLSSAELYDPKTGSFSPAGSMGTGRSSAVAVGFPKGRDAVLVAGGTGSGSVFLASAELYDARTNRWSTTGSMSVPRASHTATLLSKDGGVLVAGGADSSSSASLSSAEIYGLRSGRWTPTGNLSTARSEHAAVDLQNGQVLVVGGQPYFNAAVGTLLDSAELFDPRGGSTVRR